MQKIFDLPKWQIWWGKNANHRIFGILFSGKLWFKLQRCRTSSRKEPNVTSCESTTTLHMFAKPDPVQAFKAGKLLLHDGLRLANVAAEVPITQSLTISCFGRQHLVTLSTYWDVLGWLGILTLHQMKAKVAAKETWESTVKSIGFFWHCSFVDLYAVLPCSVPPLPYHFSSRWQMKMAFYSFAWSVARYQSVRQ